MSDGWEEREEQEKRRELEKWQEKEDRVERREDDRWAPERPES